MDESSKNSPCKECKDRGIDPAPLAEADHLRQHLSERDEDIIRLEAELIKGTNKIASLEEQVATWREKYERLYDSHKRVQKLNQNLEDKLLQMVDKMKEEKSQLTKDIATLSIRLAESKHGYGMLQKENERYKNDMNLAIQLLQCKPDNFVTQKLDNLSTDTQARVSQYVMSKTKSSGAQSKNGNEVDTFDASEYEFNISASLMSKILEDSIHDTVTKHCDTCMCSKSKAQPFCYNESHYSVSTQTLLSGEMKNSLCLNCNSEIRSLQSNLSLGSGSPRGLRLINERSAGYSLPRPMYIIPQPTSIENKINAEVKMERAFRPSDVISNLVNISEKNKLEASVQNEIISAIGENLHQMRKNNGMNMEPAIHHKLCDRTKTPMSSKKSSCNETADEEPFSRDLLMKEKMKSDIPFGDSVSMRKYSQSSMGGVSRTSSVAKSTASTHKSHTHVGPGPRFCSLRMQAGSKNILLDNAQPDVPPILYKRQTKFNDTIFKDLNDPENFIDTDKVEDELDNEAKNNRQVVESTLIDVHVDSNTAKEVPETHDSNINPILLNVSSSPLEPLKSHNLSNESEKSNNNSQNTEEIINLCTIDKLVNSNKDIGIKPDCSNKDFEGNIVDPKIDLVPNDSHDIKIFNFDRYEQTKVPSKYNRSLRKIDMSQLHSIENTKISKDFSPLGEGLKMPKLDPKSNHPTIVNVYPNLTQTHLKVKEHKKVLTNEQSTSSLSSDDSAAILQKQQLLRVAEWVEQNLEQQNSFNSPSSLDEDVLYNTANPRPPRQNTATDAGVADLALNMPHPVSKYSKPTRGEKRTFVHTKPEPKTSQDTARNSAMIVSNIVKETIFPVECGDGSFDSNNSQENGGLASVAENSEKEGHSSKTVDKLSKEEMARMEYNVKAFLLNSPYWVEPQDVSEQGERGERGRRTSSKTETDV